MNHPRILHVGTLLVYTWFIGHGDSLHAEILVNGVPASSPATIQAGDLIVGSGPTAGVVVNGADDLLSILGGTVDITGAGSIGVRVLDGSVTMSGGVVKGAEAGVLVQGGAFQLLGGGVRDGVKVQDAGSLFAMSGGTIANRNVVASSGGAITISGGLVSNSRVQAVGPTSRVEVKGGAISWLDAIDGGAAHVYGTAFSINNTPVDFAGGNVLVVPPNAGYMSVTYANRATGSFKLWQPTGGTVTLHALPAGDFDADGDVDGADFLKWQRGELQSPLSTADLTAWQANYGSVAPQTAASTAVPEPSTPIMLFMGLAALHVRRFTIMSKPLRSH